MGEDLGIFEHLEITATEVKMRVQINGLLPLIKSSVIEYSNGDEVTATFVYEKLEKHCSKCFRLDHEKKDCLVAKHEERAQKTKEDVTNRKQNTMEARPRDNQLLPGSGVYHFSASNPDGEDHHYRGGRSYDSRFKQYDARHELEERRRYRSSQETLNQRKYREDSRERQSFASRSSYHRDTTSRYREVSSRPPIFGSPNHSLRLRGRSEFRREGSKDSNGEKSPPVKGNPLRDDDKSLPPEAVNEALGEVREAMLQYTQCADPMESAARRERMRKAEEQGQMEESARRIVRNSFGTAPEVNQMEDLVPSAERIPATLRLGPPTQSPPAAAPPNTENPVKRKPGRPPGKRTVQQSPKLLKGSGSRKRKLQQTKPPLPRRRVTSEAAKGKTQKGKARATSSRGSGNTSTNSEDQPICNMIPASARRRVDFQNPSTLGP